MIIFPCFFFFDTKNGVRGGGGDHHNYPSGRDHEGLHFTEECPIRDDNKDDSALPHHIGYDLRSHAI